MKSSDRLTASLSTDGRYRLLVEAINDYVIYMLDADGIVSSWNPGAQRFKGYTADEIIGQHFSKFYPETDRAAGVPTRVLETAARTGKFEAEGWRMRKDGTGSGPMSSSTRSAIRPASSSATPRSRAT